MINPEIRRKQTVGYKQFKFFSWLWNIAFGDEMAIQRFVEQVNVWTGGLILGFMVAVTNLILIYFPSVRYLYASPQVNGFELTLPEAMASVEAWAWFKLIINPIVFVVMLTIAAYLISAFCRWFHGDGGVKRHLAFLLLSFSVLFLGRLVGYFIVMSVNTNGLMSIRDLSPGVGLGLLPFFTLERLGPFFWEAVRGFDLFGIWAIMIGSITIRIINNFSKVQSIIITVFFYSFFLLLQWVIEGPGQVFWRYFWTTGNF